MLGENLNMEHNMNSDTEKKPTVEVKNEEHGHVHGPHCNHHHHDIKPIVRQAPKIGRNDPCSCGSQKKFKKCCAK